MRRVYEARLPARAADRGEHGYGARAWTVDPPASARARDDERLPGERARLHGRRAPAGADRDGRRGRHAARGPGRVHLQRGARHGRRRGLRARANEEVSRRGQDRPGRDRDRRSGKHRPVASAGDRDPRAGRGDRAADAADPDPPRADRELGTRACAQRADGRRRRRAHSSGCAASSESSTARATSTREDTSSLWNTLRRWVSTVFGLRNSAAAISGLVLRSTTSRAISSSRAVRDPTPVASALPGRVRRWILWPSFRSSCSAAALCLAEPKESNAAAARLSSAAARSGSAACASARPASARAVAA